MAARGRRGAVTSTRTPTAAAATAAAAAATLCLLGYGVGFAAAERKVVGGTVAGRYRLPALSLDEHAEQRLLRRAHHLRL